VTGQTGGQRYFNERSASSTEYQEALEVARARIATVDGVVRALDEQRQILGLSKAELARRAGMRPEVVRRLLSSGSANPTLATVISIASAMSLDITVGQAVTGEQSDVSETRRRTA
jgi:DNA-binding phage protein